jgi:hypothetical protein
VIAVEHSSRTVAAGPTRDVVLIDAVLERVVGIGTDDALGVAYVTPAEERSRAMSGAV